MGGRSAIAPLMAVAALAAGGLAAWERQRGWGIEWPLSTLVVWASILPCLLCLVVLALALRALRGAEGSVGDRRVRAGSWCVAGLGLALAGWAMAGAAFSANPFDTRPPVVDALPPSDHPTLLVVRGGGIDTIDLARPSLAHLGRTDAFFASLDGAIQGAWWSPSRTCLILYVSIYGTDAVSIRTLGLDGASASLARFPRPIDDGTCAWLDEASTLACVRRRPASESTQWEVEVTQRRVDGSESVTTRWDPPLAYDGRMAFVSDGVVYADRCASDAGVCLYRARLDGAMRTLVGPVGSGVCALGIAGDGTRVAYGRIGDPNVQSACIHVGITSLDGNIAPHDVAHFVAREPHQYGGAQQLTFSPDGASLALLSDEEDGCAGAEGWSACDARITTMRLDGQGRSSPTRQPYQDGWLVWLR